MQISGQSKFHVQSESDKMRCWEELLLLVCSIVIAAGQEHSRVKRIVGGEPAKVPPFFNISALGTTTTQVPPETEPVVFVKKERRSAVVNGITNEDGTSSFLGIRYAEPPVKRFRFQRPKRVKLKGEIDATKFGPPCPQPNLSKSGSIVGNEDCLHLNVFTPKVPSSTGGDSLHPVIFWIHGGNYKTGSSAQYVPTHLVRKGVVVVTVNYRLGSLGFLSLGRKDLPGNVGLFDISLALRWVRNYIKFFGGNPKQIVPAGQGSGASCATMLALNKLTKSSLTGILAMSGTPVSPFSTDENEIVTSDEVSVENGCDTKEGVQFVRCMQQLPLEQVMKGDINVEMKRKKKNEFPKGLANLYGPGPAQEGNDDERFLPNFMLESPLEAIKKGHFPKIPLMTGVTKEETGGGVKGNFLEEVKKQLTSPQFLQSKIFTGALNSNTGLFVNRTVNPQLSSLFLNGNYIKFFTMLISSALSDVQKIVKHTTDAFFNLPAFITSHLWSQKTKVYLYSFEHFPQESVNSKPFLGIPLESPRSSNTEKKTGPEHGDDLAYLFDIRSLEGEPLINDGFSKVDETVRDHFTTLVAEFARTGVPRSDWTSFTAKDGNYMIINDEPKLAKNFHKCEMGMWSGDEGLLKSPECSVIGQAGDFAKSAGSTLLSGLNDASGRLGLDKISQLGDGSLLTKPTIPSLTNPLNNAWGSTEKPPSVPLLSNPLGNLWGGNKQSNENSTKKPETQATTKKQGLFGGFGNSFG